MGSGAAQALTYSWWAFLCFELLCEEVQDVSHTPTRVCSFTLHFDHHHYCCCANLERCDSTVEWRWDWLRDPVFVVIRVIRLPHLRPVFVEFLESLEIVLLTCDPIYCHLSDSIIQVPICIFSTEPPNFLTDQSRSGILTKYTHEAWGRIVCGEMANLWRQ